MQTILVYFIFGLALVYGGWRAYKSVTHKNKTGCAKCGTGGDVTAAKTQSKS